MTTTTPTDCLACRAWITDRTALDRMNLARAARERGEPIDHTYAAVLAAYHHHHEETG